MSPEEFEAAVAKAVEKVLLRLPEVIGNIMMSNALYAKLNKEFYAANPDFANHKDIVKEVVSMIEGRNPLQSYEQILKAAVPEIRKGIQIKSGTDNLLVEKSQLNLKVDNGLI